MAQARRLAPLVAQYMPPGIDVEPCACRSQIGSGALPVEALPSGGLRLTAPRGRELEALAAALRDLPRPVIGHMRDGALVLDLRCLTEEGAFLESLSALPGDHGLA